MTALLTCTQVASSFNMRCVCRVAPSPIPRPPTAFPEGVNLLVRFTAKYPIHERDILDFSSIV